MHLIIYCIKLHSISRTNGNRYWSCALFSERAKHEKEKETDAAHEKKATKKRIKLVI